MSYFKMKKQIDPIKIEKEIADFEKNLDFEFIPVIANKSSYVEHIRWILSLLILLLLIPIIELFFFNFLQDSWVSLTPIYIICPIIAYFFGTLLDKSDIVDRFFISKTERKRQVQEKAELFFFKNRLHGAQSYNVLLLYISVMERQIVLYHDQRITLKEMDSITSELLIFLQDSFKQNLFEDGILKCVKHLKERLSPQFAPFDREPTKVNHHPNKLIWIENN